MAKNINIFGKNNIESENNNTTVKKKDVILSEVKYDLGEQVSSRQNALKIVKSLNVEKKVKTFERQDKGKKQKCIFILFAIIVKFSVKYKYTGYGAVFLLFSGLKRSLNIQCTLKTESQKKSVL